MEILTINAPSSLNINASGTRHGKLIENTLKILEFITGGNSVFTIKNTKTGNRATYKVVKIEGHPTILSEVWVFTGSNNQRKTDYDLIGFIDHGGAYNLWTWKYVAAELARQVEKGPKGNWVDFNPGFLKSIGEGKTVSPTMEWRARSACKEYKVNPPPPTSIGTVRHAAFPWVWDRVRFGSDLPPNVEVWHEGGCCHCAHKLTVPASIELGLGPDCASKCGRSEEWENLNKLLGSDLEKYANTLAQNRLALAAK